jgi:uncharacterized membrane-anchored protein YjiN (DUF445 family)
MSIETEMANDITNFEQPINKITILILLLENNKVVNILKNRLTTLNNRVLRKEVITYLKSIELLKEHKIQYILQFMMNKSLEELNSNTNLDRSLDNSYKLTPFTSLANLIFSNPSNSFASTNSLILIVSKNNNK